MLATVFVPLVCLSGLVAGASHKLPPTFPRCHKKDPNIDTCLLKAIEKIHPPMSDHGIPSLGVFPLDPLAITQLQLGNTKGGSVDLDLQLRDLVIKGLASLKITHVKSDLEKYYMYIKAHALKPLDIIGKYTAKGKVLILPITGNGDCKLSMENLKANLTIFGKEKKNKEGVKFMEIKDLKVHFETSRLNLHFQNLVGGSFGDEINTILNDNWRELLHDLQPGVEEALAATFKEIAQRIFTRVPYDQIFL